MHNRVSLVNKLLAWRPCSFKVPAQRKEKWSLRGYALWDIGLLIARGDRAVERGINRMQNDQRDSAVGSGLIARVGRIDLQQQGPKSPALIWRCGDGLYPSTCGPNLHQCVRVSLEVEPPDRVVQRTTIRRHEDEHIVDREGEQRRRPQFAGPPT